MLITTDDQTVYDLDYMPITRRVLGETGTELTDFVSPHPLCCPARAQLLTGQYAHNNGVHANKGRWGGANLIQPGNNIGAWAQDAGYRTAFVGKFLNRYPQSRYPVAGWDMFNPSTRGTYNAYGTTYYNNGSPERVEDEYTADYIGRKTIEYATADPASAPFLIWASHLAPHGMQHPVTRKWVPPIPASRHRDLFSNTPAPSVAKPSFNEFWWAWGRSDVSDKPAYLDMVKRSPDRMTDVFRARIQSLQAVDEQVGALVSALSRTGQLTNTIIAFTSDNGYLLGEHRLTTKNFPYEEAVKLPFLISGPGIPAGDTTDATGSLLDLPATFVEAAGATPGRTLDGTSLFPVLTGDQFGYRNLLIQAGGGVDRLWQWRGVRGGRWTYVEHYTGEVELYDRRDDPFQLMNLAGRRPRVENRLAARLDVLRACAGPSCFGG